MEKNFLNYREFDESEIENIIQRMIEISKTRGIKITTPRILIFKELVKNTKYHPSVEDLYQNLKGQIYGLSLSTIYRTLNIFEQLGLVRRIPTPDGKAHYEIANYPHGHFICKVCGKIFDLDINQSSFKKEINEILQKDFEIESCNILCYGTCKNCSKQS